MRRTGIGVAVLAVTIASAAAGAGLFLHDGGRDRRTAAPQDGGAVPAKDGGGAPDPLAVRPGSRRELGRFVLRGGRTLRLEAAETLAGKSCLLEVDVSGTATSCLDGGLFALHRAAFGVSSEGGPDRFTALRLAGVAAPEIASITLVRTDGSSVELGLSRRQAFVYEAAEAELAAGVLPAALVLEARSGRVVEEIAIPAVG